MPGDALFSYVRRPPTQLFANAAKRSLDVSVASTAFVLLTPLFLTIYLLMKLTDGGPVFFKQTRVGKGGRRFTCFKFRSMVLHADKVLEDVLTRDVEARRQWQATQKLVRDPRVTKLGHFMRKTSLDELPQLINVITGDMSLVGPRPIVPGEIPRYGDSFQHYAAVRPGITGLWQVSGRNDCPYPERVALDVRYTTNWTFLLDVTILIKTIPAVLNQRGNW